MTLLRSALAMLLALPAAGGVAAAELHVSTDGADDNSGTSARPLRTLAAAQKAVRTLKAGAVGPITVLLHKGTYYLDEPLVFTSEDSGTPERPVVYAAAPGEEVVVSGGVRLDLKWEDYRDGIKKSKAPQGLAADQLFVNGERQHLARYPNFDPKAIHFNGSAADAISKERVKRWADPKGGFLHAMHRAEWGDFHYVITGKDVQGNVTLEGGWQNNRKMGMHPSIRFVENIFEELDAPGEWFLDSKTSTLYFYPPRGLDLGKAVFEAVRLRHLVEFKGSEARPVRAITIKGLTFRHTARTFMDNREPLLRSDWTTYRGGAVVFTGCEDCALEDCTLDQVGGNAVFVNMFNHRVAIRDCRITRAGGNGVAFVGDPKAVRSPLFEYGQKQDLKTMDRAAGPKTNNYPADCVVEDCLITQTGRVEKQTAPVQISMSQSITVRHCSLYDVPRAGINISEGTWGGHVVEFCDVFDTVQETGDHGSFNSWGRDRYWLPAIAQVNDLVAANPELPSLDVVKPNVLRNNRWRCDHGWDIDLDDGSSNYHIFNNLCLHGGLKLREGFRRTVENNIIVGNSFHPHVWYAESGDVFAHNIVGAWYKPIRMPKVWGKQVDFNLLPDNAALRKSQDLAMDQHSLAGDPLFVQPAKGDYRVKDDSPALKLGFKNFPMDQFGVTNPRLRALARTPKLPGVQDQPATEASRRNANLFTWHGAKAKNVVGVGEVSASGLPGETGVVLVDVPADSAASKVGLKKGDVVLKVDDNPVKDAGEFLRLYFAAEPRSKVKLGIWRDQKDAAVAIERGQQIVLRAATAQILGAGTLPRYDPKKDFLGGWVNPEARLSWKAVVTESGAYSVQILFACAPDSAGAVYELAIGGNTIKQTVEKTGHWEDFTLKAAGRVKLKKGDLVDVTLRPLTKPAASVMNFRAVILEPTP